MIYERTFFIQAAHFNDQRIYGLYREAIHKDEVPAIAVTLLIECVERTHGHNFKIVVRARGPIYGEGFVIDDERLATIVSCWDNVNLSVHDDFHGIGRATVENMADTLLDKLQNAFGEVQFEVEVHETRGIMARAGDIE